MNAVKKQFVNRRVISFTEASTLVCYSDCVGDEAKGNPKDHQDSLERCHKRFIQTRELVQQQMFAAQKANRGQKF